MVARNHITWLAKSFSDLVIDSALAAFPMMGIAVLIELANGVTLQCSHDADPREHRRPVGLRDQVRHRTGAQKSQKPLILLAIPAERI
jgi:hypothetical protein